MRNFREIHLAISSIGGSPLPKLSLPTPKFNKKWHLKKSLTKKQTATSTSISSALAYPIVALSGALAFYGASTGISHSIDYLEERAKLGFRKHAYQLDIRETEIDPEFGPVYVDGNNVHWYNLNNPNGLVKMNWEQARQLCTSRNLRLPSIKDWERLFLIDWDQISERDSWLAGGTYWSSTRVTKKSQTWVFQDPNHPYFLQSSHRWIDSFLDKFELAPAYYLNTAFVPNPWPPFLNREEIASVVCVR